MKAVYVGSERWYLRATRSLKNTSILLLSNWHRVRFTKFGTLNSVTGVIESDRECVKVYDYLVVHAGNKVTQSPAHGS